MMRYRLNAGNWIDGTWFSTHFVTPFPFFQGKWAKMGYLASYCSVLPRFFYLLY